MRWGRHCEASKDVYGKTDSACALGVQVQMIDWYKGADSSGDWNSEHPCR